MKPLMIILGIIFLFLGVVGIIVPLLPTTPFLLLSAALFFRSSPRLHSWLYRQPALGPYIRNFREHKAIPLRAKVVSVLLVWSTLGYCAFFVARQWWVTALLLFLALAISWHILSFATLRREK